MSSLFLRHNLMHSLQKKVRPLSLSRLGRSSENVTRTGRWSTTHVGHSKGILSLANPTEDIGEFSFSGSPWLAAVAAAVAVYHLGSSKKQTTTDCCGIVGVVGTPNHDAREFLLEGLTVLKNRGYDSAGLSTMAATGGPLVRNNSVVASLD